ncbi:MAG TPA: hypothetical protein VHI52_07380, partial [Verrucomicrobiae bacterium]|nr:hypothetical protein [Verrucomicrobiae bacterium]
GTIPRNVAMMRIARFHLHRLASLRDQRLPLSWVGWRSMLRFVSAATLDGDLGYDEQARFPSVDPGRKRASA